MLRPYIQDLVFIMSNVQQLPIIQPDSGVELVGYTLDVCIGSGSSGDVWLAYFEGSPFAIKVMKPELYSSSKRDLHLRRFRAEVDALHLMALEAHIPDLYEVRLETVPPFFVMSFVDGNSFAEDIASGQMMQRTVSDKLRCLADVAKTLDAVHQMGYLHRDVKPANIRGWETPYLLDFSISLPLDNIDSANPQVGTQFYMPPFSNLKPSIFTDNFAFALVCYEVLFGRHALYTISDHRQEIRKIGREKLDKRTWYRPSTISSAELPINLRGANLEGLDSLFQEAFTNQNPSVTNTAFVDALVDMIDVPDNEAYIDLIPTMIPLTTVNALNSDIFTDHEVDMHSLNTNLDAKSNLSLQQKVLIICLCAGILALVGWLAIVNL